MGLCPSLYFVVPPGLVGLPSLLHALIADFGLNHGQFCTMGVAWSMVVGRS